VSRTRRNPIASSLKEQQYHLRTVPGKPQYEPTLEEWELDDEDIQDDFYRVAPEFDDYEVYLREVRLGLEKGVKND